MSDDSRAFASPVDSFAPRCTLGFEVLEVEHKLRTAEL